MSALNLQASISRSKFFLQYDNTANLLVAEGLEIVRFIHDKTKNTPPNPPNLTNITPGVYQLDYNTIDLTTVYNSTCLTTGVNSTCDLELDVNGRYQLSSNIGNKIFYRFVEINTSSTIPKVTSTVIVKNPRGGIEKKYQAIIQLY